MIIGDLVMVILAVCELALAGYVAIQGGTIPAVFLALIGLGMLASGTKGINRKAEQTSEERNR